MNLDELIATLEACDPTTVVPIGFGYPHSHRGQYERLAFEPVTHTTVEAMLASARSAVGATYEGYKGGEYRMDEYTRVYLAKYGEVGEEMSTVLLAYMTGTVDRWLKAHPEPPTQSYYEADPITGAPVPATP